MKRHMFALCVCLVLAAASRGQAQTLGAFSGTWLLDLDRSTFQTPNAPVSVRMVISASGHLLKLSRTDVMRDGSTVNMFLEVQLPARVISQQGIPFITSVKSGLRNGTLLIERNLRFPNGTTGALILNATLIEQGATLLSVEQEIVSGRRRTDRLYFIKRAPAGPVSTAPDSPP